MSANESNVNHLILKVNSYNQSVFVPFNIKCESVIV